jgi:hypothetical protein
MADNFDLRKFLTENKLTKNTQLLKENTDVAQAFSKSGLTGKVTVVFYSDQGMGEPEIEVMDAQDALSMITDGVQSAEDIEDVIITQGDDIDQQGEFNPETQGLECVLEVAILDHGTYEVYQGANESEQGEGMSDYSQDELEEAAPASMQAGFDMVSQEKRKHAEMMRVANKLFPQFGGQLVNFKPLTSQQREMVYQNLDPAKLEEAKSYKTSANSKEAQYLKKGDIIGSGEEVVSVSAGAKTPSGKVEVTLKTKDGKTKTSTWGKTTKVGVKAKETVKENKMTKRDQYLTRLVENALQIHPSDDDELEFNPADAADELDYRRDQYQGNQMEEADDMVEEKPMPKYENIEKLMQEIDKSTDEEAHKFKVQEMKRVADMLEKKCTGLEEGDNAEHIDQKKLKQMKKDIMSLRKGIEKMEKLGEKKFTKKETKAEMKEGFDLRKFLIENKLTPNSKVIKEEKALDMSREAAQALQDAYENIKKVYATFSNDSRFNDVADKADERMILDILELINNKLMGYSNNMGYGSGAKLGYKTLE